MGSVRHVPPESSRTQHFYHQDGPPRGIKNTPISQQRFFKTVSGWFDVWMPWQRQVLLCGITSRCSPKQLEYLATALEPIFHRDFLASHRGQYPTALIFGRKARLAATGVEALGGKRRQFFQGAHGRTIEDFAAKYVRGVLRTAVKVLSGESAPLESVDDECEHSSREHGVIPTDDLTPMTENTNPASAVEDTTPGGRIPVENSEKKELPSPKPASLCLSETFPKLPLKSLSHRKRQLEQTQNLLTHPRRVLPPLMEVSSTSLVGSESGLEGRILSPASSRRSSVHERFRTYPPDGNVERLMTSLLDARSSLDAPLGGHSPKKFSTFSWCMDHRVVADETTPPSMCSSAGSESSSHKHKSAGSSKTASTQDFFPTEKLHRLGPYYSTLRTGKVRCPDDLADIPTVPQQKSYKPSRLWYRGHAAHRQRLVPANRLTMKQHFSEQIATIWQWMAKAEDHERLDFLTDLLKLCEQELLNFFSKCLIKRLRECSNINDMPDKLLLNVFSFLAVSDLKTACLVCRRWNYIASHDELWRQKVLELGLQEGILNLDEVLVECMRDNSIDWKAAYEELVVVIETAKEIKSPQQKIVQVKDELRNYFEYRVQEILSRIRPKTQLEVEETFSSGSSSPEQSYKGTRRASGVVELEVTFMSTTQSQIDAMTGKESDSESPEDTSAEKGVMGIAERRMKRREQMSKAADFALDVRPDPVQATDILSKDSSSGRPAEVYPARDESIKPIKRVRRLQGHMDAVCTLMFDRRRIITGSMDHSIRVWDIRSGRSITKIYGHMGGIRCLQFNESYIISGSWDMSIRVWDIVRFTEVTVLTGHMGVVSCLQFNRDFLVTGSHDKTVRVWSMGDFTCRTVLQHHRGAVTCLIFHEEQLIISGSTDRTVKVSDIHTGECLMSFTDATEPVSALHVQGNLILGATTAGQLFCWRHDTGEVVAGLQLSNSPIYKILFSPDTTFGPRFLIGLGDGSIQEWDLVSMSCLRALYGHKGAVRDVQSSSDRIVSCSDDGNVRIWDLMPPSLRADDRAEEDTIATTTIHQRRDS